MAQRRNRLARFARLTMLASPLVLAGCVSLGGAEPPPSLLTLTPSVTAPAGAAISGTAQSAIIVAEPETPARLAVNRVPVQLGDTEVAYLKEAVWVERPSRLFRRLLAETLRASGGRLVFDSDETTPGAVERLGGTLREFGYDAASGSVVVRFDAVRTDAQGHIWTRRFESIESGVLAKPAPVGDALNRAANAVAGEVAAWVAAG